MGISYEKRPSLDDAFYFRVHYAAQPFCRVRDTGHEWEMLSAPGKGPKNPGPYYAASFAQAKRWIFAYGRHHEHRLIGRMVTTGSYKAEPDEGWPWPEADS
jgi:hypothetical protein